MLGQLVMIEWAERPTGVDAGIAFENCHSRVVSRRTLERHAPTDRQSGLDAHTSLPNAPSVKTLIVNSPHTAGSKKPHLRIRSEAASSNACPLNGGQLDHNRHVGHDHGRAPARVEGAHAAL